MRSCQLFSRAAVPCHVPASHAGGFLPICPHARVCHALHGEARCARPVSSRILLKVCVCCTIGPMAFLMEIPAQYGEIGNFGLSEGLDSLTAEENTFTYVASLRSRSFHYEPFCPPCREGWGKAPVLSIPCSPFLWKGLVTVLRLLGLHSGASEWTHGISLSGDRVVSRRHLSCPWPDF